MAIGAMRRRMLFETEGETPDGGGGYTSGWSAITTVWGSFKAERGTEKVQAGRLADPVAGVVKVRSSTTTRTIDAEDRVTFGGDVYQIRSIINPDQRNRWLEMVVERGVAT